MNSEHYPFELSPLPYDYDALEPYIDAQTMHIHHDKHLKKYIESLNHTLEPYKKLHTWSLTQLINNLPLLPYPIQTAVKNNAGGVYNHNLYFSNIAPPSSVQPKGELLSAIISTFGSFAEFKLKFNSVALDQFGSGYAWLVVNQCGFLKIISTPNQDTPLPDNLCPVMIIDVWEHAYYLKYQNRRIDYINNWWNVVNWDIVSANYILCLKK